METLAQVPATPTEVYVVVGFLVVSNLGSFVALLRGVWWLAKLEFRVGQNEKDTNSAFAKIRDLEITKKGE